MPTRVDGIADERVAVVIYQRACRFALFEYWHAQASPALILDQHRRPTDVLQSYAVGCED